MSYSNIDIPKFTISLLHFSPNSEIIVHPSDSKIIMMASI